MAPRPPLRRRPRALARRLLGCDPGAVCVCAVWLGGHPPAEAERAATWGRRPLLDGVGELCPWRRGRVSRAAGTQLGPFTSHPHQRYRQRRAATASSAGRRLLPTASASAPPVRRSPFSLWFQSQGQAQWVLLADNETAQELQHGCGDDCSRSASLAALHARTPALLRAVQTNATCTSLAHKACV